MPRKVASIPPQETSTAEANAGVQISLTLRPCPHRGAAGQGRRLPEIPAQSAPPRIPRITRLMALAIKFQDMVDRGEVRDYADIARLGYVTRARLTQLMNLTLLAPDVQEELIGLEQPASGAIIVERHLRSVAKLVLWQDQRLAWKKA